MRSAVECVSSVLVRIVVGLACVSCGDVPFCVPWVDTDQQYQVEFLDRAPTDEFFPDEPTCGSARFLMDTGDVLPMHILSAGATTCREAGPVLTIPDVQIVGDPHPGTGRGHRFIQISTAMSITQHGECAGDVVIAVTQVSGGASVATESDYVLHRSLIGFANTCVPAGIIVPTDRLCTDSWYVKITDSTGRVITKHPDGGI